MEDFYAYCGCFSIATDSDMKASKNVIKITNMVLNTEVLRTLYRNVIFT